MQNQVNGVLWKCSKSKSRSPDLLGKLFLNRELLTYLQSQLPSGEDSVLQIACWKATSEKGKEYYRVEGTPLYWELSHGDSETSEPCGLEKFLVND